MKVLEIQRVNFYDANRLTTRGREYSIEDTIPESCCQAKSAEIVLRVFHRSLNVAVTGLRALAGRRDLPVSMHTVSGQGCPSYRENGIIRVSRNRFDNNELGNTLNLLRVFHISMQYRRRDLLVSMFP